MRLFHTRTRPQRIDARTRIRRGACTLLIAFLLGTTPASLFAQTQADVTRSTTPQQFEATSGGEGRPEIAVPVIPPGQEEVLATMLGRGAALPGDCQFATGEASQAMVTSTYDCPGGKVVLELRHPSEAPAGATITKQFAVVLRNGSPPAGLTDDLTARIRSTEDRFQWKKYPPKSRFPAVAARPLFIPLAVAALTILIGAGLVLRRRARSTPSS